MTTVLVTGSNGQLGKTIEELYADNNFGLDFTFVSKTEFDITNEDVILRYFRNNKFHYYNRFYLLSASVMSLIVPLLNFDWFSFELSIVLLPVPRVISKRKFTGNKGSSFCR